MRNWLRILSVILALSQSATLSAAAPHSAPGLIAFDHDIGVVAAFHEEHFCLSIKNGKLKPGQALTLVWLPISDIRQTAEIRSATVRKLLTGSCDAVNSVGGAAAYDLDAGKLDTGKIYIAVVEATPICGSFTEEWKAKLTRAALASVHAALWKDFISACGRAVLSRRNKCGTAITISAMTSSRHVKMRTSKSGPNDKHLT